MAFQRNPRCWRASHEQLSQRGWSPQVILGWGLDEGDPLRATLLAATLSNVLCPLRDMSEANIEGRIEPLPALCVFSADRRWAQVCVKT